MSAKGSFRKGQRYQRPPFIRQGSLTRIQHRPLGKSGCRKERSRRKKAREDCCNLLDTRRRSKSANSYDFIRHYKRRLQGRLYQITSPEFGIYNTWYTARAEVENLQQRISEFPRMSLLKLFGKSECAPLYGLTSRQIRAKEILFAALHYQIYVIQTPSAIFQTVSRISIPGN